MKKESQPKKFGIDIRWLFWIAIFVGFHYLTKWPGASNRELLRGFELVAAGVIALVVSSIVKHYRPNAFNYYSIAEMVQMKLPVKWRSWYESFAVSMVRRGISFVWYGGWVVALLLIVTTRFQIPGVSLVHVFVGWFVSVFVLIVMSEVLGWNDMAERKLMAAKMKPIPKRGKKVELYDFETGKPLAHISADELQFLIDSYRGWGLAENDFYIMRETVDLLEQQKADPHLVSTLRQIMGKKNHMEIGWTLV